MKVLHMISGGDDGGAKTHIFSLIKELNKSIPITLVCFIETDFYYDAKKLGIDIRLIKQKNRFDLSVVKKITNLIHNENFDILHCHGARANFIGRFILGKINIPSVTTIHSDFMLDFQGNFYKQLVFKNLNIFSLKNFKYFIAVSQEFKNMLIERKYSKDKIFVVYNGVDFNTKLNLKSREKFLSDYKLNHLKDNTLMGIVARLVPVKGHKVLLNAFSQLLKKNNDIHLLLIGDGEEKEKLIKLTNSLNIYDHVHFLGFVSDQYSFFNTIDINVLTSFSESFPYVLLEGAMLKKPTIASNVGGIPNLIKDNETGLLFESGNDKKLANKMEWLVRNNDKADELGENLYAFAKEFYSVENMANTHLDIYEEMLSK